MKSWVRFVVLLAVFLLVPTVIYGRHIGRQHSHHGHHHLPLHKLKEGITVKPTSYWDRKPPKHKKPDPLQIAGSSLPDCSHACGSCSPCRLVMVSFVCSSLEEAETCPMAYRCMCNNKSYPVP